MVVPKNQTSRNTSSLRQRNATKDVALNSTSQRPSSDKSDSEADSDVSERSDLSSAASTQEPSKTLETSANPAITPVAEKAPFRFSSLDYLLLVAITIISMVIRCHRISEPTEVVFDEVHFGKFAGKYLNRSFFFDLHPPLAKLMFTAAGKLSGYDGIYDFNNIGDSYITNNVSYIGMRLMSAILGVLTIPATFVTVRAAGFGITSALFGAIAVCFENGLAAQSRLILLDSVLIFFSVYTTMCYLMFRTYIKTPFTPQWWFWLLSTGFNLGCAISSKWIAAFLVAFIGLSTIYDLWETIADKSVDPVGYTKQFAYKALSLIILPLMIYLISFIIHFQILYKIDKPDAGFSKEFNSSFEGAEVVQTEKQIYYGSVVRIKHTNSNSGYIHSHAHDWVNEKSSKQQQVTIYGHPDGNNLFAIEPAFNTTVKEKTKVKNGDIIRLQHVPTKKRIHSHDVKPPLSTDSGKFEVSGYGALNFPGDSNDNFKIEIVYGDKKSPDSFNELEAINTKFRIVHVSQKCVLYNSKKKLPKYAFEQHELVCMSNCKPRMSTWHIEYSSSNVTDPKPDMVSYKRLNFFEKTLEYNKRMVETNNELVGSHPFASRPDRWPLLYRGTAYWGGKGAVIYMLGNPIVYWLSTISMVIYILLFGVNHLYYKRTGSELVPIYNVNIVLLIMGYALHYFPFYMIKRELFMHHYLVALWFSIVAFACILDNMLSIPRSKMFKYLVYGIAVALIVNAFIVFYPISYASQFTKDMCGKMKWLSSWDIDCNHAL
ncbi:hypothetical protein BB561_000513 [Smittium simulii]|uniref:Dolichyl-phosphate-mannose--protein mannosyltransferase n=1 Tax=Smittium simulii TaxID=133385 RepID=A0A2T9YYV7_9FUNG|nr:hypothetical protein BB561_000513 [Smittium simulii]